MDRQNEIECKVLGAVIWKDYLLAKIGFLSESDFQFVEHRKIWVKIMEYSKKGIQIDPSTLYYELKNSVDWIVPPADYLAALVDCVSGLSYIEKSIVSYAKEIKLEAIQRQDNQRSPDDILRIADELKKMEIEPGSVSSVKELLCEELNCFDAGNFDIATGYKTGITKLDRDIGGFRSGELIVLAGRPASGKTTLALNMAYAVAERNKIPVLFINLEMTSKMLIRKIISHHAQIPTDKMNVGLSEFEIKKIMAFGNKISNEEVALTIYDRGSVSVAEIEDLLKTGGYKFVVIDQLTKIRPAIKRDRFDLEVADKTFALKEISKQYQVPILLLHQANREVEKRSDKRPILADLRDSGAIEQDADIVLFVHRDALYTGEKDDHTAIIRISKNKMGKTRDIKMIFNGAFSEFKEEENE